MTTTHTKRSKARPSDLEPGAVFLYHDPRSPAARPPRYVVLTSDGRFRYLDSGIVTGGTRPALGDLEPAHVVRGRP